MVFFLSCGKVDCGFIDLGILFVVLKNYFEQYKVLENKIKMMFWQFLCLKMTERSLFASYASTKRLLETSR